MNRHSREGLAPRSMRNFLMAREKYQERKQWRFVRLYWKATSDQALVPISLSVARRHFRSLTKSVRQGVKGGDFLMIFSKNTTRTLRGG